jgi:hypothetical protein
VLPSQSKQCHHLKVNSKRLMPVKARCMWSGLGGTKLRGDRGVCVACVVALTLPQHFSGPTCLGFGTDDATIPYSFQCPLWRCALKLYIPQQIPIPVSSYPPQLYCHCHLLACLSRNWFLWPLCDSRPWLLQTRLLFQRSLIKGYDVANPRYTLAISRAYKN